MPRSITIRDAAANTADAAVIAAAFATGSYDLLKGSFDDRIHQPHRMKLVPFLRAVVEAGEKAGSLGGWLSGSGSTICSLSPDEKAAKRIATAMRKAGPKGSKILICSADNKGARIIP